MEGCGEIWRSRYGTAWSGWVGHGEVWRSWLGAARSGIAWLGPAGFGTAVRVGQVMFGYVVTWFGWARRRLGKAVVATCDKARLGWQGWAV